MSCGFFAAGAYVGGWAAYGAALVGALACLAGTVAAQGRRVRRLRAGLDGLAAGGHETPAGDGPDDPLAEGLRRVAASLAGAREATQVMEQAFRGVARPALYCGADGTVLAASAALAELLGKGADKVVGRKAGQAFFDADRPLLPDAALRSGAPVTEMRDLTLWDGRKLAVELACRPVGLGGGSGRGVVVTVSDLTASQDRQREVAAQQDRLSRAGARISELAEHVASATELLSASADDQAQGAQKQRGQTTAVATAMEEMTGTVMEVARNASATSEAAASAQRSAGDGAVMVTRAVAAINEVSQSAAELGREVGELDARAEEIGRIIGVINDIADQTNLLALNAAIEAARAGDAGRGFAVVADEVRKLAEKTMAATKEVEQAIGTIQERSRHAMAAMRRTEEQVGESTSLSNQAGDALQLIMESIGDMVQRVEQIATAAEEQSASAEEIKHSVEDIADIAGEADEAAGQAAGATRDLARLAQDLLDLSKGVQGDEPGRVKLRESEGRMKGILPKLALGFIRERYGEDAFEGVREEMGHPVFLPAESYPDQVLSQMAELASALADVTVREFFLDLGRFTIGKFHEMYPGYFKDESLKSFYLRMNDVHAKLTKATPGIKPPDFTYEDKGDDLFMNYRSSRGLFDYFEGILLGAAEFKGERVRVRIKPFDETTARAEIVFLGKDV
ncbi:methyl-accepting chemotaxis protein [Pseudodesulfovibrio sp.]|uniref:methyl-accepting chemotaxis protein n=1 Tax=Pseudodesulfovibrio sp. TaxID=2035812 RepID=UPI0026221FCC|nr:methyl-accepting chemotaxis protein [Pseudodesulfovibrio sp.]MDD3310820.1 methyl-accepting chemotaxis protein [Pseudodesulfovibrio sp.]